jgi:hypothetical protein
VEGHVLYNKLMDGWMEGVSSPPLEGSDIATVVGLEFELEFVGGLKVAGRYRACI